MTDVEKLRKLFTSTRRSRLDYKRKGDDLSAAACAIRESCLLDCMKSLDHLAHTDIVRLQIEKIDKWKGAWV